MKKIVAILGLSALCTLSACSSLGVTYVGKSYPVTTEPELFFSWNDVPRAYETMGYISSDITWSSQKTQNAIVKQARKKGADAIVFDNPIGRNDQTVVNVNVTPDSSVNLNSSTAATNSASSSRTTVAATFIKFK